MCSAKSCSKSVAQTWPLWATQTWFFWVSWCTELPQVIPAYYCFSPGRSHKGSPCHAVTSLASLYACALMQVPLSRASGAGFGLAEDLMRCQDVVAPGLGNTGLDKKCWNQGLDILCFGVTPNFFSVRFNPLSGNLESVRPNLMLACTPHPHQVFPNTERFKTHPLHLL